MKKKRLQLLILQFFLSFCLSVFLWVLFSFLKLVKERTPHVTLTETDPCKEVQKEANNNNINNIEKVGLSLFSSFSFCVLLLYPKSCISCQLSLGNISENQRHCSYLCILAYYHVFYRQGTASTITNTAPTGRPRASAALSTRPTWNFTARRAAICVSGNRFQVFIKCWYSRVQYSVCYKLNGD